MKKIATFFLGIVLSLAAFGQTIPNITSFGTLAAGNQPLSLLDTSFGAVSSYAIATNGVSITASPYLAKEDCSTDDTASFQAAINYAVTIGSSFNGGAIVLVPATTTCVLINGTITLPNSSVPIRIVGVGGYVSIQYTGSGDLFAVTGSSMSRNSYITFENLVLQSNNRHVGVGIHLNYTDVTTLKNVRFRTFQYGMKVNNSTGVSMFGSAAYDDQYCVEIGSGSGGFNSYGTAWDSCQLDVLIDGSSTGVHFWGDQFDTDASGLNGALSNGAMEITGNSQSVDCNGCTFFTEAVPTTGATVLVNGSSDDVHFNNNHFFASVGSVPTAIKFDNVTNATVDGGATSSYSTSSYIVTSNAVNILEINGRHGESAIVTGTGAANLNRLITNNGNVVITHNAANPPLSFNSGVSVVGADGSSPTYSIDSAAAPPLLHFRRANNTIASPSAVISGQTIGQIDWAGYLSSAYGAPAAEFSVSSTQNWSTGSQGSEFFFCTTPNGSTTCTTAMTIGQDQSVSVVGNLGAGGNANITGSLEVGAGSSSGHASCWNGTQASYCTSAVASDGTCTCH